MSTLVPVGERDDRCDGDGDGEGDGAGCERGAGVA
jgi:hypothetical protein